MGEQPDKRISMMMYGDENKLQEWNDTKNDPMPIKTMNNNGLQVLEEAPGEYKIYIDKDAVMTTVAKYALGSYQTFMERKADVDNSRSLLKGYKIEWTQKDDSELFIRCNDEAISKIENQPMTLDEPTQPVVLEPKTVPTTYECCFRVDKKTGEFYIGEGYENLVTTLGGVYANFRAIGEGNSAMFDKDKSIFKYNSSNDETNLNLNSLFNNLSPIPSSDIHTMTVKVSNSYGLDVSKMSFKLTGIPVSYFNADEEKYANVSNSTTSIYLNLAQTGTADFRIQITKTSTPKPFVKSVMPSGKLDRISNANETTHTFLNKGDGVVTFGNGYFSLKGEKIQQLLVYKALLTEQEKQVELAKDIKLNMAYNDYFIGG
ncbi:MAG: hypothetical protein ACRCTZ_23125 [Sarcina sp.]